MGWIIPLAILVRIIALILQMKYHRQLIRPLGLESVEDGAFTIYDEHLLMVIASHLAGLLENGRLQYARRKKPGTEFELDPRSDRAGDWLATNVREISQIAAELMARNFAYELAAIAVIEGPEKNIYVAGIGGNPRELFLQTGLSYMDEARRDGIVIRVIRHRAEHSDQRCFQSPLLPSYPELGCQIRNVCRSQGRRTNRRGGYVESQRKRMRFLRMILLCSKAWQASYPALCPAQGSTKNYKQP